MRTLFAALLIAAVVSCSPDSSRRDTDTTAGPPEAPSFECQALGDHAAEIARPDAPESHRRHSANTYAINCDGLDGDTSARRAELAWPPHIRACVASAGSHSSLVACTRRWDRERVSGR